MFGVSSRLSLTTAGSFTKASFGAVSGVVVEVTHKIPSGFMALAATQPAGNAGAVTPSKLSFNTVLLHGDTVAVAVAVAVAVVVGLGVTGVPVAVGVGVPLEITRVFVYRSNACNVPFGFVPSQFELSAHTV